MKISHFSVDMAHTMPTLRITMKDKDTVHLRVKKTDRNAFKSVAAKAGKSMQEFFSEVVKNLKGKK